MNTQENKNVENTPSANISESFEESCKQTAPIVQEFVKYGAAHAEQPTEDWLSDLLQEKMPEKSAEEVRGIAEEITTTLKEQEQYKKSLGDAVKQGRSKESWFASEVKKATSHMSAVEAAKYLESLDYGVSYANEKLYETILKKGSTGYSIDAVSENPNLDGSIAEQMHVQTFNMNATATGSPYRAYTLDSNRKNSLDIKIVDTSGSNQPRSKYQSKYYETPKGTLNAFEKGDYRGQQSLVPEEQLEDVIASGRKATDRLVAPDGTTSNPLSKDAAKQLQQDAQSGNWTELDWNTYKVGDIAMGIGKQAAASALQGVAIGVGMSVAQKLWEGEDIEADELVETAVTTGADFGVKAAAAGALKTASEKGLLGIFSKGTPASTFTNIAFIGIENAKIAGKVASGELDAMEGVDQMSQTTVSCVAGIAASGKGTAIGAAIGTVLGPIGTAVGGFIGGTVGYVAGSKVGSLIMKGAKVIRDKAVKVVHTVVDTVKNVASKVFNGIRNLFSAFAF